MPASVSVCRSLQELTYLLDKLSQEGGDDQGEVEEVGRERVKLIIDTSIRKAIDDVVMINQVSHS
jgi:hypothetical protein